MQPVNGRRASAPAPATSVLKRNSSKKEKRGSDIRPVQQHHESSDDATPPQTPPAGLAASDLEDLKAKQRKLLAREEELMIREQDINRRSTELEAIKAREKELSEKVAKFEIDQAKLRDQVEQHNSDVLAGALPLIKASEVKIKEKIGEGAFAAIHKAEWRGMTVAAKVAFKHDEGVLAGRYTDADVADIFFREIKIMRCVGFVELWCAKWSLTACSFLSSAN